MFFPSASSAQLFIFLTLNVSQRLCHSCMCTFSGSFLVINTAVKQPGCGLKWASFPFGPFTACSQAGRQVNPPPPSHTLQTGLCWPGLCLQGLTKVQFCVHPPSAYCQHHMPARLHSAGLPLLIRPAHNSAFLAFFMCSLLSLFAHAWVCCTEKCRTALHKAFSVTERFRCICLPAW